MEWVKACLSTEQTNLDQLHILLATCSIEDGLNALSVCMEYSPQCVSQIYQYLIEGKLVNKREFHINFVRLEDMGFLIATRGTDEEILNRKVKYYRFILEKWLIMKDTKSMELLIPFLSSQVS
jgi:hypothetical protein